MLTINIPQKNIMFGSGEKYITPMLQKIANPAERLETVRSMGVKNIRAVSPELISGSTFEAHSVEDLAKLKNAGIETIVDFRADASEMLKSKCAKSGIKYKKFPLDNVLTLDNPKYFTLSSDNKRHVTDEFVKALQDYFSVLNKENVYAGCFYGIDRTNMGLSLNFLLNPKTSSSAPEILTWPGERKKSVINKLTKTIKKILKALTDEQKQTLGLSVKDNGFTNLQIHKLLQKNNNHINTNI